MLTPSQRYQQDLTKADFMADDAQLNVVDQFDQLCRRLKGRYWRRMIQKKPVKGLYLWGSVGAGKTYLMDLGYECLPTKRKMRMHFHPFMSLIHTQLSELQGKEFPLKTVAKRLAKQYHIIFLDEFFVTDIADAMLLGRLLQRLFEKGVTLVTTSNIQPEKLYEKGLHRDRFLPAIKLIKKHFRVINVVAKMDYRLLNTKPVTVFFQPMTEETKGQMLSAFYYYSQQKPDVRGQPLTVLGRPIDTIRVAGGVAWFDFRKICNPPRHHRDYLFLAEHYHTIMVSHVMVIKPRQRNLIRNFINMVDMFYDEKVRLLMSMTVPLEQLYLEGDLAFEFKRTLSRLNEMQTQKYIDQR